MLLVNDRWLKHWHPFPAVVAGKLSDVAGLFALPIVAVAALEIIFRRPLPPKAYAAAAIFVAAGFVAVKASPRMAGVVAEAFETLVIPMRLVSGDSIRTEIHFVHDVSDLVVLPAAAAAVMFVRRRISTGPDPTANN